MDTNSKPFFRVECCHDRYRKEKKQHHKISHDDNRKKQADHSIQKNQSYRQIQTPLRTIYGVEKAVEQKPELKADRKQHREYRYFFK